MSLPPLVRWVYDYHPEANSPEDKLYTHYLKAQDWGPIDHAGNSKTSNTKKLA